MADPGYYDTGGDIVADPFSTNTFWSCGNYLNGSIYIMAASKTTDNGTNWTRYNLATGAGMAHTLAIDPTNSSIVYVGGNENSLSAIYKTTNAGYNWAKLPATGLGDTVVLALAIDPSYPNTIYAGTNNGCYKSTDGGNNWVNTGCPGGWVNAIVVNRGSSVYEGVYVGTNSNGVYLSTNWGTSWTQINQGLQDLQVNCLGKSQATYIYAGTQTKGIYRWSVQVGNEEVDNNFTTKDNRLIIKPNPARGELKISYQVHKSTNVLLGIYDTQGRLIRILKDEYHPAGTYSLFWDFDNMSKEIPAGIYFCRLHTENFNIWKRFIVVK
ncbi:MAG: T9SS type A sorting domain-containing protein [candidate division WOR-3 bacterium]